MAKILVVDDDVSNAEVLQLVLSNQRHQVLAVNSSLQVEAQMRDFAPDLIVMDILLDGVDGREICRNLKQSSQTAHIPVLLITAMLDYQARAVQSGADALMFKPFDYTVLEDQVHALLHH